MQLALPGGEGRHRAPALTAAAVAILLLTGCFSHAPAPQSTTATGITVERSNTCPDGEQLIRARFVAKSAWEVCWGHELETGLVTSRAVFLDPTGGSTPVFKRASLAQIDVPYDNGVEEHLDLPGFGTSTAALTAKECPGRLLSALQLPNIACAQILDDGLRYEWSDYDFGTGNHSRRGQCLELFDATAAEWYTYITAWTFCDDGEIQARVGAGGTLAPGRYSDPTTGSAIGPGQTQLAVNHYHNVFWRVEPDLGGSDMSEVNTSGDGPVRATSTTPITTESARDVAGSRTWDITSRTLENGDSRPRAYELAVQNADPYRRADHPYTNHDVYVTENNSCEHLAANNLHPPCGTEVDQFVNGDALADPVLWVQSSFHHRPRDEDAPTMDERWLSFELIPRGVTAANPLAPESSK